MQTQQSPSVQDLSTHPVVSRHQWLDARKALDEIAQGKVYYNYQVRPIEIDELAGTSMFYRDAAGNIFHTYSAFARGSELVGGVYGYLDHLPKGRNETGPGQNLTDWVRHHDRYEN